MGHITYQKTKWFNTRNGKLLIILVSLVIFSLTYYLHEIFDIFDINPNFMPFFYTVRDWLRLLFLIPVCYAAYHFRIKGAILTSITSFLIMLPHSLTISNLPLATARAAAFFFATAMVGMLMAIVRNRGDIIMETEQKLRIAAKNADFTIAQFDRDLRYTWIFHPPQGYEQTVFAGKRDSEINNSEAGRNLEILKQQVIETGEGRREEIRFTTPDGYRYYDFVIEPHLDDTKNIIGGLSLAVDITGRRRAEAAQRNSEERFRFALAASETGAWELNLENLTFIQSPEFDRILGYKDPVQQWTYETFLEHIQPNDRIEVDGKFRKAVDTRSDWTCEGRIKGVEGTERWISIIGRHQSSFDIPGAHMAGIVRDITNQKLAQIAERQKIEKELEKTKELLQSVSSDIIGREEAIQTDIARELHDQIGQSLLCIGMDLHTLEGKARSQETKQGLREMVVTINQMMNDVRSICNELRPTWLDELGLLRAIDRYAEDFEKRSGISSTVFYMKNTVKGLSDDTQLAIYRIVQEALTNIMKHAGASEVRINIERNDDSFDLYVQDDGVGMELPLGTGNSLGLTGMRERAELVGGVLSIESATGKGTRIHFKTPLIYNQTQPVK